MQQALCIYTPGMPQDLRPFSLLEKDEIICMRRPRWPSAGRTGETHRIAGPTNSYRRPHSAIRRHARVVSRHACVGCAPKGNYQCGVESRAIVVARDGPRCESAGAAAVLSLWSLWVHRRFQVYEHMNAAERTTCTAALAKALTPELAQYWAAQ
jgi:hypothetical protein